MMVRGTLERGIILRALVILSIHIQLGKSENNYMVATDASQALSVESRTIPSITA